MYHKYLQCLRYKRDMLTKGKDTNSGATLQYSECSSQMCNYAFINAATALKINGPDGTNTYQHSSHNRQETHT